MTGEIARELLHRKWIHSHEEDTATETIYRPAGFRFPPSRGRAAFELKPDGSLVETGIGPTDRREFAEGTWKLASGSILSFHAKGSAEPRRELAIAKLEKDRLVIARPGPPAPR